MLRNHLKIAGRTLWRDKGYAALNLVGLAVGLAACLIIARYVQHELSFDRFHEQSERIYRVATERPAGTWARTSLPAGPLLEETFPVIEKSVRFSAGQQTLVEHGDRRFYEDAFAHTDPGFFEVFDFELLGGDPETDLARPFTVLLSRSMAEKYFPEENPIGQTLRVDGEHEYEVVGLFEDPPPNSHIQFDFLSSFESEYAAGLDGDRWDRAAATYLLLPSEEEATRLEAQLADFFQRHLPERQAQAERSYALTPLHEIRLYAQQEWEMLPQGDIRYVYLFSAVALLILLIACINYMNLATARAVERTREVGVRKTVGATRGQLARQFLAESMLLVTVAVVGALAVARLALPVFNSVTGTPLELNMDGWMLPSLAAGTLVVGVLAGSYPAAFLSGFRPVQALERRIAGRGGAGRLRRGLVVVQFALSAVLIFGTLGLHRQMQLVQEQRPGFDRAQVVMMPTRGAVGDRFEALRNEILRHPTVEQATLTSYEADGAGTFSVLRPEDVEGSTFEGSQSAYGISANEDFLETFGLHLLRGCNLPATDADVTLVNEAAVRAFGWEEPFGKRIDYAGREREVIGVVEDFPLGTLRDEVPPMLMYPGGDWYFAKVAAKVQPADLQETIAHLENQWDRFVSEHPFTYSFLDADFDALYRAERRLAGLFAAAALLAILVACLGLIGLAAYTAQTRRKEIGVRKVLGASVRSIVALLSKDFLVLVAAAFVLGAPVAYWGLSRWLDGFAYRVEPGPHLAVLTGLLLLGTALLAVGYQSIRAALADPVDAIREE